MTPRELIHSAAARFRSAGIPDPEYDSALLLSSLCGKPPLALRLDTETALSRPVLDRYEALVKERLRRIPLQYILGETSFFGLTFSVDRRVLIPRPETELLCEWALELMRPLSSPRVLDLCCGSGCIGLSIRSGRPDAAVTLSDLSSDALDVAGENAARLRLNVDLVRADLLNGFPSGAFDVIVTNPPYIPSSDCAELQPEVLSEPLSALDGGPDGLDFYHRLIPAAAVVLSPGGLLLMECGIGEADAVSGILADCGYSSVTVRKDLAGIDRMICARNSCGRNYADKD